LPGLEYLNQNPQFFFDFMLIVRAALFLVDRREIERAVELQTLAWIFSNVAKSRWFEDIAGREIAAVAETLPPEVVAAAQERGRARDIWEATAELMEEFSEEVV
jgi:hypothetical protein